MPKKKEKYRILIIEDNQDLNDMFQIAFDEDEFEINAAINGIEGVTKAIEYKPHLILLDIMMPQMDGYEVIKALKKNSSLKSTIVINSNLEQKKDAEKALEMGADYYIKKSEYTPFELVQKIEEIMTKGKKKQE